MTDAEMAELIELRELVADLRDRSMVWNCAIVAKPGEVQMFYERGGILVPSLDGYLIRPLEPGEYDRIANGNDDLS